MKNTIYISFFILLLFSCSKQVTAPIVDKTEVMTEKSEQMADKVMDGVNTEVFRHQAPEAGEARKIALGKTESFVLDNGLTVVVAENHKLPRVAVRMTLKNEALFEGDEAGYTSIAGDLLSRGTTTRTKAQLDEEIDFIGGNFNTFSNGFFASSLKKHSDKLMNIVSDVIYNPSFPEEEFAKIKKQTLSGLAANATDPNAMMSNVASALNYGKDHAYGEVQTEETTENIKLETCKNYVEKYFTPSNAYLTIVGDVTPSEAKRMAIAYFGDWEDKPIELHKNNSAERPDGTQVSFVNKAGAVQSVVRVTYPVDLKPGAPDAVKASVMNSILGGGFSSRLMQNLREDKAFTYGARSSLRTDPVVGNFNASASVRNEVTDSTIHEFINELERINSSPVSSAELTGIKSYMAGGFARSLESPETIARFALNKIRYNLPDDYYDTYLQRLEAVTIADVQAMAKKYITPQNANIVVVGNKNEVADKLVKFDSNGTIDFYDNEGNIVEYQDVSADVTAESVIAGYLKAIGGKDKLMTIKDITMNLGADMMGQAIDMLLIQKEPGKLVTKISTQGMTVQEIIFDGENGKQGQMGQTVEMSPEDVKRTRKQAVIFPELQYAEMGSIAKLVGTENINGADTYQIDFTDEDGNVSSAFFDTQSLLKVRELNSVDGPDGQKAMITQDFKDYQNVDGIKIPYERTTSGAGLPAPLKMTIKDVKFNSGVEDSVFTVE